MVQPNEKFVWEKILFKSRSKLKIGLINVQIIFASFFCIAPFWKKNPNPCLSKFAIQAFSDSKALTQTANCQEVRMPVRAELHHELENHVFGGNLGRILAKFMAGIQHKIHRKYASQVLCAHQK